ncbi:hypothetical protein DEO72_LG2g354 [Vigna unguiculata]|uniref:Uncharacterized protein n=1 Tax=Vigna unguiculata TaxID=3917 RepID=A0A4D6KU97_VIGUN|nr:hypothetical protein DEO72_LG2g354 [Vigna unguiculata]
MLYTWQTLNCTISLELALPSSVHLKFDAFTHFPCMPIQTPSQCCSHRNALLIHLAFSR